MAEANTPWPPLESQLREAKAIHGSALEQLIRDNQDAQILRPEERLGDSVDLPVWLRIYWRRHHPGVHAQAGPAGDYPDVLHRTHGWMLTHQDLPPKPEEWLRVQENIASDLGSPGASGETPEGGHSA
jgi:hypothetical protein